MHKEGAIILGIGGDNSKGSAGTFYEGVMTSGYPSAEHRGLRPGQHRRGRLHHLLWRVGRDRHDRVRPQQLRLRGQQQRQRHQRQQGADLDCDGNTGAQNWTVNSNGTLTIDGGCMDITGAKYTNGTLIELWTCNGGANQQWDASPTERS